MQNPHSACNSLVCTIASTWVHVDWPPLSQFMKHFTIIFSSALAATAEILALTRVIADKYSVSGVALIRSFPLFWVAV